MGISFKVSKAGKRYHSKTIPLYSNNGEEEEGDVGAESKDVVDSGRNHAAKTTGEEDDAKNSHDHNISFVLCLYPDGYTIEKSSEGEVAYSVEVPKNLHPYDRASESLFSALESGQLPGDILDDIPCKYDNGKLVCEVQDYRKCFTEGVNGSSLTPITNRLRLRMTLENVVKDIPLISDNDWTYGDLMEVESRILKVLQPKLCLDPKPKLDRLCYNNPMQNEVNFGISSMRKRSSHIAEVTTTPSSNIRGKKVCIGRDPESSMLVDSESMLHPSDIKNLQSRNNGQLNLLDEMTNNTSDPLSSSPLVTHPSKHQMDLGSPRLGSDYRSCSVLNRQVEALNSGVFSLQNKRDGQEVSQYSNSGQQKYPQQAIEGWLNQEIGSIISTQGIRYALNKENVDYERMDIIEIAQLLRSNVPRAHLNSPCASAGGVPQSPLSSKSVEFSSGSAMVNGFLTSQKNRSVNTSAHQIGNPFTLRTSSANYLNQNRTMSGDGSPVSVSKFGFSRNVSIPCVDKSNKGYSTLIDRFSKIDTVTVRHQSNREKEKAVVQAFIKSKVFPSQYILNHLSTDSRSESYGDDSCSMPLSKSLVGGSMNVCKARVLNFKQTEPTIQGNSVSIVPKLQTRLIMSEKSNDGSVAMHIGEINDSQYLSDYHLTLSNTGELLQSLDNIYDIKIEDSQYMDAEDYLPTLPNTHTADLLASQFCSLMNREGYHLTEDHVQPKPDLISHALPNPNQPNNDNAAMSAADMAKSYNNNNPGVSSSHNIGWMGLQSENNNSFVESQGHVSRVGVSFLSHRSQQQQQEQRDPMSFLLQQQQSMMQEQKPNQHLNLGGGGGGGGGGHVSNRLGMSPHQQMQHRKMMMGLGTVGKGNIENNMVGLGDYNNVMGVSGPSNGDMGRKMAQDSMNVGQALNISNNIAQQYRSGTLTPSSRGNMLGSINPRLNRANIKPLQRDVRQMGPPKSIAGMNAYMNQQQQHNNNESNMGMPHTMNQQQNQQLTLQTRPQLMCQRASAGPQHMSRRASVGPQQMSRRASVGPQLSSDAMHTFNTGNPETVCCPASPQIEFSDLGFSQQL